MAQWCPKCRAEYVEGWGNCSTCDLPLVDERPPEQPSVEPAGRRARVSFLEPGGGRSGDGDEFVSIWEGPTPEGYTLGARLEAAAVPFSYGEAAEPGQLRLEVPRSYINDAYVALERPAPVRSLEELADEDGDLPRRAGGWSPWFRLLVAAVAVGLVVVLILSSR